MNVPAARTCCVALNFVAVLLFAANAGAEPQRLLKPEDFAVIRNVDEPQISPDGNSIVYTVKTTDLEKD
ncbi:MAG: hypothetical protein H0U43_07180, partial [Chthoniobacterales bacterium]|nr:hypothetical protein [Chthoniobacterales bacterium]